MTPTEVILYLQNRVPEQVISEVRHLSYILDLNKKSEALLCAEIDRLRLLVKQAEWAFQRSCPWCEAGYYTTVTGETGKHQMTCPAFAPEGAVR